jgi:hypothetical protein
MITTYAKCRGQEMVITYIKVLIWHCCKSIGESEYKFNSQNDMAKIKKTRPIISTSRLNLRLN